jgi:hypothetical protein
LVSASAIPWLVRVARDDDPILGTSALRVLGQVLGTLHQHFPMNAAGGAAAAATPLLQLPPETMRDFVHVAKQYGQVNQESSHSAAVDAITWFASMSDDTLSMVLRDDETLAFFLTFSPRPHQKGYAFHCVAHILRALPPPTTPLQQGQSFFFSFLNIPPFLCQSRTPVANMQQLVYEFAQRNRHARPIDLAMKCVQEPMDAVRIGVYDFMRTLALPVCSPWGIHELFRSGNPWPCPLSRRHLFVYARSHAGFLSLLENRENERHGAVLSKESKFALIEAVVSSSDLEALPGGVGYRERLEVVLEQGPFYLPPRRPEPEVV